MEITFTNDARLDETLAAGIPKIVLAEDSTKIAAIEEKGYERRLRKIWKSRDSRNE